MTTPHLTVTDVAKEMNVPKTTIYKLVREGKIPAFKLGKHWRFRREILDEWMDHHMEGGA